MDKRQRFGLVLGATLAFGMSASTQQTSTQRQLRHQEAGLSARTDLRERRSAMIVPTATGGAGRILLHTAGLGPVDARQKGMWYFPGIWADLGGLLGVAYGM